MRDLPLAAAGGDFDGPASDAGVLVQVLKLVLQFLQVLRVAPYADKVITLSLEKATNAGGTPYSKVVVKKTGVLPPAGRGSPPPVGGAS